jgi:exodeoxyribonuclease VII small subunit
MKNDKFDYSSKKAQLVQLLDWFDAGEADLDKALANYQKADELIKELEAYLKETEQKLKITIKNK